MRAESEDPKLGTFIDRYTFRYEREYRHPPERLWEALTTAEHMNAWLMPTNRIEAKLGGRFLFTFGGPSDPGAWSGTITAFTPPNVVEYTFDLDVATGEKPQPRARSRRMRFELHPFEGGTRLYFIHSFPHDFRQDPSSAVGGDLPGGPDTPWRPGFMSGFLLALIDLDAHVAGHGPTVEDQQEMVKRVHAGIHRSDWLKLTEAYCALIRATIPGGVTEAGER